MINYSAIPFELASPQTEIPINHGQTLLTIDASINFNKVLIDEASIPPLQLYEAYETQLNASGGTTPYYWSLVYDYDPEISTADFPEAEELQLTPTNNNDGAVMVNLPFHLILWRNIQQTLCKPDGLYVLKRAGYLAILY